MNNKKCRLFLLISLAVFMALMIVAINYYCETKAYIDSILSEVADTQMKVGLELSLIWSMIFVFATLGAELSFIRSVYKILKNKPKGWIRICYIISASLAFLAVAFYCLAALKMFNFVDANGRDYSGDIYLFTLWPSFIVSFVLGSIPIKHDD